MKKDTTHRFIFRNGKSVEDWHLIQSAQILQSHPSNLPKNGSRWPTFNLQQTKPDVYFGSIFKKPPLGFLCWLGIDVNEDAVKSEDGSEIELWFAQPKLRTNTLFPTLDYFCIIPIKPLISLYNLVYPNKTLFDD